MWSRKLVSSKRLTLFSALLSVACASTVAYAADSVEVRSSAYGALRVPLIVAGSLLLVGGLAWLLSKIAGSEKK